MEYKNHRKQNAKHDAQHLRPLSKPLRDRNVFKTSKYSSLGGTTH